MTSRGTLAALASALLACSSGGAGPIPSRAPTGTDAGPGTATRSSVVTVPRTPARGCPALRPDAWRDPGTVHAGTLVANETWTAEASPHRLPEGITITEGASLTLVPCALVLAAPGRGVNVARGGALFAMGEAGRPVKIAGEGDPAGSWLGVSFADGARATSRMVHTRLEAAGLDVAMPSLDVSHVTIVRAQGKGVHVVGDGSFAPFASDLVVASTIAFDEYDGTPLHFEDADAVGTLPTGAYTGNARDAIRVGAGEPLRVRHTQTWRDAGVPYEFDASESLTIDDASSPHLTLSAGATLAFGAGASLLVGETSHAALAIDGTAASRVRLRGRGDAHWLGVRLGAQVDREHTHLHGIVLSAADGVALPSDACAPPGITRAVLVVAFEPREDLVSDVTLDPLDAHTAFIARGWRGAAMDLLTDRGRFALSHPENACLQTPPRNALGVCPRVPRCTQ